jgi:hypothetical protein
VLDDHEVLDELFQDHIVHSLEVLEQIEQLELLVLLM